MARRSTVRSSYSSGLVSSRGAGRAVCPRGLPAPQMHSFAWRALELCCARWAAAVADWFKRLTILSSGLWLLPSRAAFDVAHGRAARVARERAHEPPGAAAAVEDARGVDCAPRCGGVECGATPRYCRYIEAFGILSGACNALGVMGAFCCGRRCPRVFSRLAPGLHDMSLEFTQWSLPINMCDGLARQRAPRRAPPKRPSGARCGFHPAQFQVGLLPCCPSLSPTRHTADVTSKAP